MTISPLKFELNYKYLSPMWTGLYKYFITGFICSEMTTTNLHFGVWIPVVAADYSNPFTPFSCKKTSVNHF